jgi:hypothetical protein
LGLFLGVRAVNEIPGSVSLGKRHSALAEIRREDITEWITKKIPVAGTGTGRLRDLAIGGRNTVLRHLEINHILSGQGPVYRRGIRCTCKPTFFLAELRTTREISGLTVHTSGKRYVGTLHVRRDVPGKIFLRLEPLTMLLMYKFSS